MRQPPRAFSEASPTFNVSIPPAALGQLIPGQSSVKSKKSNTPQSTTSTAVRTRTETNRRNHEFTTNKTHQVFRACRHHCSFLLMPAVLTAQEGIAYTSTVDNNPDVWSMKTDGADRLPLTTNAANEILPSSTNPSHRPFTI